MFYWVGGIISALLLVMLLVICAKINIKYSFLEQKHRLIIKFGVLKLNLSKIFIKKDKIKKTKPKTKEKLPEKKNKTEKSKLTFDKMQIFIELIPEALDLLDELAFSIVFKKIILNCQISTEDNAKTGNIIAGFWAMYGNVLTFLQKNFIIDFIDINACPNWDKQEFDLLINTEIEVETRILKILKNINFKKIKDIRKRVKNA